MTESIKEIKHPYIVEAEHWIKLVEFVKSFNCKPKDVHTDECAHGGEYGCMDLCEMATYILKEIGELK